MITYIIDASLEIPVVRLRIQERDARGELWTMEHFIGSQELRNAKDGCPIYRALACMTATAAARLKETIIDAAGLPRVGDTLVTIDHDKGTRHVDQVIAVTAHESTLTWNGHKFQVANTVITRDAGTFLLSFSVQPKMPIWPTEESP